MKNSYIIWYNLYPWEQNSALIKIKARVSQYYWKEKSKLLEVDSNRYGPMPVNDISMFFVAVIIVIFVTVFQRKLLEPTLHANR